MRIHLTPEVIAILRQPDTPSAVRQAIAALGVNPHPPDARPIPGQPSFFEMFESGFWITFQVIEGGLETIARVLDVEKN